jgi:hypothetical protein
MARILPLATEQVDGHLLVTYLGLCRDLRWYQHEMPLAEQRAFSGNTSAKACTMDNMSTGIFAKNMEVN